jgi:hypothetical protein
LQVRFLAMQESPHALPVVQTLQQVGLVGDGDGLPGDVIGGLVLVGVQPNGPAPSTKPNIISNPKAFTRLSMTASYLTSPKVTFPYT